MRIATSLADVCVVRLPGHCPSGDDPRTDTVETNCKDKYDNGATTLLFANGGGATGNLCQVDCSNRGARQQVASCADYNLSNSSFCVQVAVIIPLVCANVSKVTTAKAAALSQHLQKTSPSNLHKTRTQTLSNYKLPHTQLLRRSLGWTNPLSWGTSRCAVRSKGAFGILAVAPTTCLQAVPVPSWTHMSPVRWKVEWLLILSASKLTSRDRTAF